MVAVEDGLADVMGVLRERGYQVVDLNRPGDAGMLVVTGQDTDVTGVGTVAREVPLVVARGRTAHEVADEVDRRYPTRR